MVYRARWKCSRRQLIIVNRCYRDRKISYGGSLNQHRSKKINKYFPNGHLIPHKLGFGRHLGFTHPTLPWGKWWGPKKNCLRWEPSICKVCICCVMPCTQIFIKSHFMHGTMALISLFCKWLLIRICLQSFHFEVAPSFKKLGSVL